MKERCYKDNLIIVLSVILVIAVIGGCVAGVVFGLGGDVKAGAEVAEAYNSSDTALEPFNTFNWNGYLYYYFDVDFSSQVFGSVNLDFDYIADFIGLDSDNKIPAYYTIYYNLLFLDNDSSQWTGNLEVATYSKMNSNAIQIIEGFSFSMGISILNKSLTCYSHDLVIEFVNDSVAPFPSGVECEVEITRIVVGYFDIQYVIDENYDLGYDIGYDEGYDLGYSEGRQSGFLDGSIAGYDQGYNQGYDLGYGLGYDAGRQNGYYEGIENAGDYSWYALISAVFDAPLKIMIGEWQQINGQWQLVGGMLNFNMPGLDINFAPVLTSLFTLVILIVLLRFIFSFIG